ncbi:MAG: OmpA family protein [Rhodospirillaceae bacterium]|nr:OmpA family protein [Rhodospirillales bacterium]
MNGFLAALVIVCGLISPAVGAAEPPSAEDIAAKLNGAARSFVAKDTDRGITNIKAEPDGVAAIDLTINFEFNSAALTPDGMVLAGNLGRALKDPRLEGKRFRIEGHTDAVGGDAFNQRLSQQRAEAVRHQLITANKVKASRLEVEGYGESRLLDPSQPTSGINRRVRVVNLGGGG